MTAAPGNAVCPRCERSIEASARFCRHCGTPLRTPTGSLVAQPAEHPGEPDEVVLPAPRRIQVEGERISLRALQQMVSAGVDWWQMRLQAGEATREEAVSSIEELRKALGSLSHQLAQGRETIRITTTLTPERRFPVGCPRCGKGNRINARFCISCGLPLAATLLSASEPPGLRYTTGLVSDVGARRRVNQDSGVVQSFRLSDNTKLVCCLVADGMGGAQGGERASALACQTIINHLLEFCRTVDKSYTGWRDVARAAIAAANSAIFREAEVNPDLRGMGTTVVLCLVIGETAYVGSAGDSRVYLLNQRGVDDASHQIAQITVDHTMVARLVDIGQLTAEQARTHPRRNVLYRSVGVEATVESDVTEQPLQSGDWLLLCSDGLTNELSDDELRETLFQAASPQEGCASLIAMANSRGARDNVTALVLRAEDRPAAK
jgi:PPM family protein phosphatase